VAARLFYWTEGRSHSELVTSLPPWLCVWYPDNRKIRWCTCSQTPKSEKPLLPYESSTSKPQRARLATQRACFHGCVALPLCPTGTESLQRCGCVKQQGSRVLRSQGSGSRGEGTHLIHSSSAEGKAPLAHQEEASHKVASLRSVKQVHRVRQRATGV